MIKKNDFLVYNKMTSYTRKELKKYCKDSKNGGVYNLLLDNKIIYTGSTNNFYNRIIKHYEGCMYEKSKEYNKLLYKYIRSNNITKSNFYIRIKLEPILSFYKSLSRKEREKYEYPIVYEISKTQNTFNKYTGYSKYNLKEYRNEYNKAYYQNNKEKEKQRQKKYREKVKNNQEYIDKKKESDAKYREKNREKIRKKQNEKVSCPKCNKIMNKTSLSRHLKNKTCIKK